MDYYEKQLFLAKVDKDDNIIGKTERWQAHKAGILHRGFTLIMTYQNSLIVQHRKHPIFDGYFDLSFSSHPVYNNEKLQTDFEAIDTALKREWNIDKSGLITEPKFLGKFYYQAKDPDSIYTEHEIDYIYQAELKNLPNPNLEYAYGFELVKNLEFEIKNFKVVPWVKKIVEMI